MKKDDVFKWGDSGTWPYDAPGMIFVARAVERLGHHLYADWQVTDSVASPISVAGKRFEKIKEFVRESCAWGTIVSCVQFPDGSFSKPIPASHWNTDRFQEWFRRGKLSPVDAFGGWNTNTTPEYWLFFTADTLEASLAPKIEQERPTTAGRAGFKQRLVELMEASPTQRTISKDRQIEIGIKEFNLSGRDASGVRDQVLREVADHIREAWSKRGPTVTSTNS